MFLRILKKIREDKHYKMVQTSLEPTFSIDHLVSDVFSKHPLYNAIMWDYFCNGDFGAEIITQAFYGIDKAIAPILATRLKTPEAQVVRFWELYAKYMIPPKNLVYAWHSDLLEEIVRLRGTYGGERHEEPPQEDVFTRGRDIVDAMCRTFPDKETELREIAGSQGGRGSLQGFGGCVKFFLSLFTDDETRNSNLMFPVLEVCVRQLTQFTQNRREETRAHQAIMPDGKDFLGDLLKEGGATRLYTAYYPILGTDLRERITIKNRALRRDFWSDASIQTLLYDAVRYDEERWAITRLIMYSNIDRANGIGPAMDRVNEAFNGIETLDSRIIEMGTELHKSEPMSSVPWRCEGGDFPADSGMEQNNYDLLEVLIFRIPSLDHTGPEIIDRTDETEGGLLADMPAPGESPDPFFSPKRRDDWSDESDSAEKEGPLPTTYIALAIGAFALGFYWFS